MMETQGAGVGLTVAAKAGFVCLLDWGIGMQIGAALRAAAGLFAGLALCGLATWGLAATDGASPGLLGARPVYREIEDWVIACDNTRACEARFSIADAGAGDSDYGDLRITRQAGPEGALLVEIMADGRGTPPDPNTLRLDHHKLLGAWTWKADPKAQTISLFGAKARAFVRTVIEGDRLDYSDGEHGFGVSLSGLKAALLAMDEDQGRLDGETALARPGPRAMSSVPAALAVPQLWAAPALQPLAGAKDFARRVRRSQAAVLKTRDCEPQYASEDAAWALDREQAIVLLGCNWGAYQGWVVAFVAPRATPERAHPLILSGTTLGGTADKFDGGYTSGDWDPKRATFSFSAKGRGLADCGASGSWVYDGKTFRLSAYNKLNRCSGLVAGDWPTLYRTRVMIAPAP
jgi:hypothetical protein